ncbi:DUF3857 domain-containing protein [Opitutus sp. GAS368]|uniref:transglutaminase domain-containing protein n=1 Tax=Opitutus sp. GAS368 TaxID=1882749 RepID=UPI00087C8F3F|nr:DUF3857 domain-containing protein [Opitutus sp. GAS368]SDS59283.1 Transglutaminase-like superfamily protein [Opitutus sp. GAS368]
MTSAVTRRIKRRDTGIVRVILGLLAFTGVAAKASQPPAWLASLITVPASLTKLEGSTVVLREEATVRYLPGGKVRETFRQAIRVVTLDGLPWAHPGRSYNADTDRILKAQAWVVSPDGRHTDEYGRSDFINVVAEADPRFWHSSRVVGLANVSQLQVGGIAAVELEIERQTGMNDSSWSFLGPRPVEWSVFEVVPLPGEQLVYHASSDKIPPPVSGSTPGSLRWEVHDLATIPHNMPGGFIPNPRQVNVRSLGPDSLASQMKTWGQFASLATKIVEPRMIASPFVVAQAQALAGSKTDRWARIRSLTESVQKQVAYLSITLEKDSLAGMRPHLPEEVLRSQLGDCKDKSTLLVTMLRSLGERAYDVVVHANNPKAVMPEWPSQIFNHVVVGIVADAGVPVRWPVVDGGSLGKLVIFDPTDPATPLGALPLSDQGGLGLVVAEGVQDLITLPSETPEACNIVRHLAGELTAAGDLIAEVDEVLLGARAAAVSGERVRLGDAKFRQRLEAQFHAALPFLSDLSWTEDWFPADVRDHIACKFKAARAMRTMGTDTLLVCPRLVAGDFPYELWKTNWEGEVRVTALGVTEEVRMLLPEGFTAASLPSNLHQELPFVTASLAYRLEGRMLVYSRQYSRKACLLAKNDYDAICRFNQKLDEAERRPAMVRRRPQPAISDTPGTH